MLSADGCSQIRLIRIGFNPFQGIQVLSVKKTPASAEMVGSFNPFQGIQVLSAVYQMNIMSGSVVSIPFREFKCCRTAMPQAMPTGSGLWVSIPFREFKCCRARNAMFRTSHHCRFQSLSGNSSVVGIWQNNGNNSGRKFQSLSGNSSVVGN